jgi:parvulin-like peptidyl-prolyl isomerase
MKPMTRPTTRFLLTGALVIAGAALGTGCSDSRNTAYAPPSDVQGYPPVPAQESDTPSGRQSGQAGQPVSPGSRPIGYLNGQPIRQEQLQTQLVEAAGGQALFEFILDTQLADELKRKSVTISDSQIQREQRLLLSNLDQDTNQAQRLLNELRDRRGLGETRYRQLLYRNAALRALVAGQVQVSQLALEQEYEVLYGPRYEIRLITVPSLSRAQDVLGRLRSGGTFPDVAIQLSTDSSRAQGGLLTPFSSEDQSYPKAIRDQLPRLKPGQVSDPIALEDGFAIIRLERKIDGLKPPFDSVKGQLSESVKLRIERMLMDQLVRAMMDKAQVTLTSDVYQKAWQIQQKRFGPAGR